MQRVPGEIRLGVDDPEALVDTPVYDFDGTLDYIEIAHKVCPARHPVLDDGDPDAIDPCPICGAGVCDHTSAERAGEDDPCVCHSGSVCGIACERGRCHDGCPAIGRV